MTDPACKVCLLGDFGVGKTSLISRFVHNTFSENYLTTVGVKVDTKTVCAGGRNVKLVIWDIAGHSSFEPGDLNYLKGASGLLLVCDGTREPTLRSALRLLGQSKSRLGDLPAVLLVNKLDLVDRWEVTPQMVAEARKLIPVFESSAKMGDGVEAAFSELAAAVQP
jgi:small GTP-binding protein